MAGWKLFRKGQDGAAEKAEVSGSDDVGASAPRPAKWSLGILNDKLTDEVPGEHKIIHSAPRDQTLTVYRFRVATVETF